MAIKIISEKPITIVELKEELERIKKRDKELNFRANKTDEYLNQFAKIKPKDVKEIAKKIEALKITRLKEDHIVKIIDLMPSAAEDLKSILQSYSLALSNDNLNKIVDIVKEFKK